MSHVNYDLWFKLIKKISASYFSQKPIIFELGGGTGSLAKMLINDNFSYYGSDLSFPMCKEAEKKNIPFFCADALQLPLKNKFNLIIFLYDGINYLQSINQFTKLFHEVYHSIASNGYFLFDITTKTNSLNNFYDIVDSENFSDSSYTRHSYYDNRNNNQINHFTIYTPSNEKIVRSIEIHSQKIFSVKEIIKGVPQNIFSIVGIWDGFSFKKHNAKSERIHFLLKKIEQ